MLLPSCPWGLANQNGENQNQKWRENPFDALSQFLVEQSIGFTLNVF